MTAMTESRMRREVLEIPDAVDRLPGEGAGEIAAASRAIADRDPACLVTVARGSSDHTATFLKHAAERLIGLPVASVHGRRLRLAGGVCLALSQSGRGPDLVALAVADAAEEGLAAVADDPSAKGATVSATSPRASVLPTVRTPHPLTDPLALTVTFCAMVEEVARARGIDPDAPRDLRKVTETA
jgi:fructoselysine-6-P-deglycase FrlB-like protein